MTDYTAQHFRMARAALGWSQGQVAAEVGADQSVASRLERDGPRAIRPATLAAIVAAFERHGIMFGKKSVSWRGKADGAGTAKTPQPSAAPSD